MKLLSVNVSQAKEIVHADRRIVTGILKTPVAGRVTVRRLGLDGDRQVDTRVHGGPFMAVYAYAIESYRWWSGELGVELPAGHFGENLTVEGLTDDVVHIGDVLEVGEAVLQVTQPRLPCGTLGARMGDLAFPKRFLAAGRLGFYLRVLREVSIGAGDPIRRTSEGEGRMTVRRIARLRKFETGDLEGALVAVAIEALSPRWKSAFMKRLERAGKLDGAAARQPPVLT